MTAQDTPAIDLTQDILSRVQDHKKLADWMAGSFVKKTIAAMMISAAGKKPGKVLERVAKPLGRIFEGLKVVSWTRNERFVYAVAFTKGDEASVLALGEADGSSATALFQTDLYLKTHGGYTELDAITVCAITEAAISELVSLRGEQSDIMAETKAALTAARIFATGLPYARIEPADRKSFLVPFGEDAFEAANLPIERTELGKTVAAQILSIRSIRPAAALSAEDRERMGALAQAMTKAGHPGPEKFGVLVALNAR